jgi:hypothetical protein
MVYEEVKVIEWGGDSFLLLVDQTCTNTHWVFGIQNIIFPLYVSFLYCISTPVMPAASVRI